jgi:PQQ-dependent catabolism-associated CXXCW motif protein
MSAALFASLAAGIIVLFTGLAAVAAAADTSAGGTVAEPAGYRMSDYRAPVPATLAGARVIDTEAAHALWNGETAGKAVFIDVLPQPQRPPELPADTYWRSPERLGIPGSIWLANTGYGTLAAEIEAYFLDGVTAVVAGDPGAAIVFYCKADCWMSWNAAKRAIAAGFDNVVWYPEGTDGWQAAGHPLAPNAPVPVER